MIDCHCHLCDNEFEQDRDDVIFRAKQAGVRACLINTEAVEEFPKVLEAAESYPGFCIPCFGIHPVQYDINPEAGPVSRSVAAKDLEGLDEWFEKYHQSLVAIGETGLDYTPRYIHSEEDKPAQRAAFSKHIELSKKYDLPLICHSRSSGKPVIEVLKENNAKHVLLHAFDGNVKSAQPGVEAGFYFSIPPSVARSPQKQSLLNKIPLEQILLETDSPVLGPDKNARNEPMNVNISCEWIAKAKNLDIDNVKRVTTENAMKLFPKLKVLLK